MSAGSAQRITSHPWTPSHLTCAECGQAPWVHEKVTVPMPASAHTAPEPAPPEIEESRRKVDAALAVEIEKRRDWQRRGLIPAQQSAEPQPDEPPKLCACRLVSKTHIHHAEHGIIEVSSTWQTAPAQPHNAAPDPALRDIEKRYGIVIVSRHAGAIEWLRRRGITGRVVEHAYPEDIRQRVVYGILPFHLAALAKELVMIDTPLIPLERRGGDLSPEEMDKYGAALTHYVVLRVPQTAKERDE